MMALILSIGFVVDDAIVMLENIVRHIEHGETPLEAALNGSKEIGFTILTMTMSLAAVFIPILFMSGILGRLFREFAVTITRGDPDLRRRVGHADADAVQPLPARASHAQDGASPALMDRAFDALLRALRAEPAAACCGTAPVMLVVFVAVLVAHGRRCSAIVPKGFIPDQDNDSLNINLRAAQGTSFYDMVDVDAAGRRHRRARTRTSTSFFVSTGGGGGGGDEHRRASTCS